MQQTLFYIPHQWFDGRLLWFWMIVAAAIFAYLWFRHGWGPETKGFIPVVGIVAAAIYFVLPQLEVDGVNPADPAGPLIKQGLAIRGYGVFLLLAISAGIVAVLLRCQQAGVHPDQIFSLAFWMIVCGIIGARVFYVLQKSEDFFGGEEPIAQTLIGILDMTKGGLVVYGSLIGGMAAAIVFFAVTKLPALRVADLIAPGMMLGLAIGRVGCLMNGCCYGGLCESELPAIRFPAGSPPYMQQLAYGDLLGMETKANDSEEFSRTVTAIIGGGVAEQLGIEVGDTIQVYAPDSMRIRFLKQDETSEKTGNAYVLYVHSKKLGELTVPLDKLPARSLRVHPAQIYSTINATLLFLVLWFFWTVRRNDGEVFALMLILYSVGRFMLEIVRRDEAGFAGSSLTISQWVSVFAIVAGLALWGWVTTRPERIPPEDQDHPVVSAPVSR
jgi:phosphatidylglycerol:prolipoprotein diacylglycerol transferase